MFSLVTYFKDEKGAKSFEDFRYWQSSIFVVLDLRYWRFPSLIWGPLCHAASSSPTVRHGLCMIKKSFEADIGWWYHQLFRLPGNSKWEGWYSCILRGMSKPGSLCINTKNRRPRPCSHRGADEGCQAQDFGAFWKGWRGKEHLRFSASLCSGPIKSICMSSFMQGPIRRLSLKQK